MDTALAYGEGHSEALVGRAVREWGRPIVIASKIPPANRIWPAAPGSEFADVFPRKQLFHSTEATLRNLGMDCLDVQQLHVWNPAWTPQEEWRRAFEDLKQEGKARFVGVSLTEHDAVSGIELARSGSVDALQVLFNIFDPRPGDDLFPVAAEHGVGILVRVPFDEGSLAGCIAKDMVFDPADFRAWYFRGDRHKQVVERVGALQRDIAGIGGSLSEMALRFCLTPVAVSSVIPGMRRPDHVRQNARAAEAGPLSQPVLSLLDRHRWEGNFYL